MLIICSLQNALDSYRRHRPARVVSLLSEDEETPGFPGCEAARHLKLYVEDESCAATINAAARRRAREIIDFVEAWKRDGALSGNILVHCNRGVSRSTAAAYIILCAANPDADESALLKLIRRAAPHADPCPLIISYADEILGRDGRMLDALDDLGPPVAVLSAPPAEIALTS